MIESDSSEPFHAMHSTNHTRTHPDVQDPLHYDHHANGDVDNNVIHPFGTYSMTTRRRPRTAKEASSGIEDILMEMPSRTIGRRAGARVASPLGSVSSRGGRYDRRHILTHQDSTEHPDVVQEICSKITDDEGEINLDEIRGLPVNMAFKREIRRRARANQESQKLKRVGRIQLWRYSASIKVSSAQSALKRRLRAPKLWNHQLKQVEGNFGSGVLSYFTFLRGLFFLSIPSFILNFGFITLPQLLDPPARTNPVAFTGEELLTGANWLTETTMYYGYYTNETISVIPGSVYKMPLAYLLATAGYFVLCLVWLTRVTATSFRLNFVEGQATFTNFIGKVFCAWDFAFTSPQVAKLHRKMIFTDLKEILAERIRSDVSRPLKRKCEIYLLRLVTWMVYLGLTGGSMALVFFVNQQFLKLIIESLEQTSIPGIVILEQISLALIVSAINLFLPIFINALTHFEKYKNPRHEVYIAVLRNFLLKMGLLAVICAFWTDDDLRTSSNPNVTVVACWETELGQEIYRLVVVDFLFSIIFATFCAEFLRKIFSKFCCKGLELAQFSIVNNVMDLIYGQTLCWIGVFFSPLLPLVIIIKYFLLFYVKQISVMRNCQASRKRWRAAQSRTLFNGMLLISFLLSAIFLCVVVFREKPSEECGPYRGLNLAYDVVVSEFATLAGQRSAEWFTIVMEIVTNVWFLNGIIVFLIVFIFLKRSKAVGYADFAEALRQQMVLEGQDKQLLLSWLQNVSNGSSGDDDGNNHRVPILTKQAPDASPPEEGFGAELKGNVLTYVDPQHVNIGNFGKSSNDARASPMRKKSHKDPLLNKARSNQERPHSMYTDTGSPSNGRTVAQQRNSYAGGYDLDEQSLDDDSLAAGALAMAMAAKSRATTSDGKPDYQSVSK